MRPDPRIDCRQAPVITIGGQEFFVPTLALRQARIVVPGLLKLMPRLAAIQERIGAGDVLGAVLLEKDDVELMLDLVHCGLTRAYPELERDHLLDLQAGLSDLVAALGVIARQTGLFSPAEASSSGE